MTDVTKILFGIVAIAGGFPAEVVAEDAKAQTNRPTDALTSLGVQLRREPRFSRHSRSCRDRWDDHPRHTRT